MRSALVLSVAVPLIWLAACSSSSKEFANGDDGGSTSTGDDDSGDTPIFEPMDGSGIFVSGPASDAAPTDTGPCKGGHYQGTFLGLYNSHITVIGFPIPVTGDVQLDLDQAGSANQTCTPAGEIPVPCNQVFSLQNGIIEGTADKIMVGDASAGGFPYFCTMTGTLDCKEKILENGWIQCTYCIGPLADGGLACELGNGVGGTTGVGGHFAGPLKANYDYGTLAFVMGTWNGAEALAGNNGMMPGPDGGSVNNYLSDAGYFGPTDFGGNGTWGATWMSK
jgi:hypothetical protein